MMDAPALATDHALSVKSLADFVESLLADVPQVECPVVHRFGPGIYIRELTVPAGTLLVGKYQKYPHANQFISGTVAVFREGGAVEVLKAPMFFIGQPGQKVGYVVETMVWQNIYANPTDETDVETLEAMFMEKNQTTIGREEARHIEAHLMREADRHDFLAMAAELGTTPEQIRLESESGDVIASLGAYAARISIRDSAIEGRGVFVSCPVDAGNVVAPARIQGFRTMVGRYTNHSARPNARAVLTDTGDLMFVALRRIEGCRGGDSGEELTVDYRQVRGVVT